MMDTRTLQQKADHLVRNEVIQCVSMLVSHVIKLDPDDDELMDVCSRPDPDTEDEYIEALEHWTVTEWLADRLLKRGEMVIKDWHGLNVWGRTTSGQAISIDYAIEEITKELHQ